VIGGVRFDGANAGFLVGPGIIDRDGRLASQRDEKFYLARGKPPLRFGEDGQDSDRLAVGDQRNAEIGLQTVAAKKSQIFRSRIAADLFDRQRVSRRRDQIHQGPAGPSLIHFPRGLVEIAANPRL